MAHNTNTQMERKALKELERATPGERRALLSANGDAASAERIKYAYNLNMDENAVYEAYALLCEHLDCAESIIGASFESPTWEFMLKDMATSFEEHDDIENYKRLGSFEVDRLRLSGECDDEIVSRGAMFLTKQFQPGKDGWFKLFPFRLLLHRSIMDSTFSVLTTVRKLRRGELRDHVASVLNYLPAHWLFGQEDYFDESIAKLRTMCEWKLPKENKELILSFLSSLPPETFSIKRDDDISKLALWPVKHTALTFTPYNRVYASNPTEWVREDNGMWGVGLSEIGKARDEFDHCKFQAHCIIQSYIMSGKDRDGLLQEVSNAFTVIRSFMKLSDERCPLGEWEGINKLCDTFESAWLAFALGALLEEETPWFKRIHDEVINACYDESLSIRELELLRYTLCQVCSVIPFCVYIGNRDGRISYTLGFEVFVALLRVLNRESRLNAVTKHNEGSAEASIQAEVDKANVLFEWALWEARLRVAFNEASRDESDGNPAELINPISSIASGISALNGHPDMLEQFYTELAARKNLRYKAGLIDQSAGKLGPLVDFTEKLVNLEDIRSRIPRNATVVDVFFVRDHPLYLEGDQRAERNDDNKPRYLIAFVIGRNDAKALHLGIWDEIDEAITRYKESWRTGKEDPASIELLSDLAEKVLSPLPPDIDTVLFCSDGPLNNASFASFPYVTSDSRYVSDRFAVRNIASAEDIAVGKTRKGAQRGLVLSSPAFADPDRARYPELEGSKLEGMAVIRTLGANLGRNNVEGLSGKKASSTALIKSLSEARQSIIHLSSHGDVIDGVPCVILEDNLLRPGDIPQEALSRTDLIVFALCHAGAMETVAGDGLSGFVKSVLLSGAVAAVLPIDAVDDMASLVFFKLFYEIYLASPFRPIESVVQETTRRMRGLKKIDLDSLLSDDEIDALENRFGALHDDLFADIGFWGPWVCYSKEVPALASQPADDCNQPAKTTIGKITEFKLVSRLDKSLWGKALDAYKARKFEKAFNYLEKIEAHGNLFAAAARMYSLLFLHGITGESDKSRSFHYAELAANDDRYADILGQHYLAGIGCDHDLERGAELIERAEKAQENLVIFLSSEQLATAAKCFLFGIEVFGRKTAQSYSKARSLSKLALAKDEDDSKARIIHVTATLMDRKPTPEGRGAAVTELWELCSCNTPEAAALAFVIRMPGFTSDRTRDAFRAAKTDPVRFRRATHMLMRLQSETWTELPKGIRFLLKHPRAYHTISLIALLAELGLLVATVITLATLFILLYLGAIS